MWASDPYPGSMHDVAAPDASGLLEGIDPSGWIGDKGYVGRGMITPHKKPPNGELSETAKEENKSVNRIRRAERAHHRPHQILENPPHPLQETPGNIRADHHRSTRTIFLQDHPLNNLPGLSRYPATSLSAAGSASSWAEPMCSMLRDPQQEEECAICTARNAVLTVRTYRLTPPRQCASPPTQPVQFQREPAPGPPNAPQ